MEKEWEGGREIENEKERERDVIHRFTPQMLVNSRDQPDQNHGSRLQPWSLTQVVGNKVDWVIMCSLPECSRKLESELVPGLKLGTLISCVDISSNVLTALHAAYFATLYHSKMSYFPYRVHGQSLLISWKIVVITKIFTLSIMKEVKSTLWMEILNLSKEQLIHFRVSGCLSESLQLLRFINIQ